ncbi:MAG: YraN family protein [Bergeyella zoohelcum]|nr:YraN family protein [Bergeyella zoohelcum]
MAEHIDFGKKAENFAVDFLEKNGYKILERNFRFQKAEIDIIAENTDKIIIVEVKARASNHFINPEEAVNKKKMRLLLLATNRFLEIRNIEKEVRFDIISLLQNPKGDFSVNHIENAFDIVDIQ